MIDNPQLHRQMLTTQAYANEKAVLLRKRTHDLYTVPSVDFPSWVLDRLTWSGTEKVLDVGSGPATYVKALQNHIPLQQYTAIDLSVGMLKSVRGQVSSASAADAEALPFPDHTFDIVLANHVLYHIPDVDLALQEIRRVLRPSGVILAATNSQFTMPEFNTLIQRTFRLLGYPLNDNENPEYLILKHFSLETGTVKLARYFPAVARYDIPSSLVFNDAQPVLDYIDSARHFYHAYLPEGVVWEDFMAIMSNQVRRLVSHFGELVINKLSGVLIGTEQGGFAEEFQRMLTEKR